MKNKLTNILDWVGVCLIMLAYLLLSLRFLPANSVSYIALNIIGAILIAVTSFKKKDYQPAILNIFWVLISVIAVIEVTIK